MNASYTDSLTSSVMEHWYKVTLPEPGELEVSFSGAYASDGTWGVSLRDGDNNEISYSTHAASSFNAGNPATSVSTTLPAGTYYIRVNTDWYGRSLVNLPYELTPYRPETIADATVSSISAKTYTGKAIEPRPTVSIGGTTLNRGTDYTLSYENNTNAGEATIVVKGAGKYFGSKSVTFTISKAANPAVIKTKTASVKRSKVKKGAVTIEARKLITVSGAVGAVSFKKASGSKKLSISSYGTVTVKKKTKKGTYQMKVKVTVKGDQNHKKRVETVTLKVKVK